MSKANELYRKAMEDMEESYDDKDFVDTYDYEEENKEDDESDMHEVEDEIEESGLDELDKEDEFVGDLDDDEPTSGIDVSDSKMKAKEARKLRPEVKFEPGSVYGIRHYTDRHFDEEKARKLFYEGNESDQIEALLYAQFFARKTYNCRQSHMFIMRILTKDVALCKSPAVYEQAQYSFYYFFRTYLLRECQKFADSRDISQSERQEYVDEALQTCHAYVFKALPKYDVDSGFAISTYFQPFIKDALTSWESIRKGRTSKSTMRTDAAIVNAQKELMAEGITPTPVLVALRTKRKVEETSNSMARIKAENTMISKEANDLMVSGKKQDTFLDPDKSVVQSEMTGKLIEALQTLNQDQRRVLCYTLGIAYDESQNVITDSSVEKMSLKQISNLMKMDVGEVKALQVSAKRQLESIMRRYMDGNEVDDNATKNDTLLRDRHMIFSSSKGDDEMMEIIGEIDNVSDGTKDSVTEAELKVN